MRVYKCDHTQSEGGKVMVMVKWEGEGGAP